jgi:hypothetical protein
MRARSGAVSVFNRAIRHAAQTALALALGLRSPDTCFTCGDAVNHPQMPCGEVLCRLSQPD